MQRYRVNYRLLASLFLASFVTLIAGYFLWRWQVNRKATWFREGSQVAIKEGKTQEAFDLLLKYVQFRSDETEPRVELANIGLDILKDSTSKLEQQQAAYGVLTETVRRTGDPKLRLELTKLILPSRPQDALGHLEELLSDQPDNSELLSMQAQATYKVKGSKPAIDLCNRLVGLDVKTDKFDSAKATAKDRPEVYMLLASLVLERDKNENLARRVIDQMVVENPKSADAFLTRSVFLRTTDDKEESLVALAKAYELDPENVEVLQQKGSIALEDKNFAEAEKIFSSAIDKHPDRANLYEMLARTFTQQEKYDEALATLDLGSAKMGANQEFVFAPSKLDILLQTKDFAGVEKVLAKLLKSKNPRLEPFAAFTRARILWQQQKWTEAAKALEAVRPTLLDFPQQQAMAGALLATCYEKQGKPDLAIQAYEELLAKAPNFEPAIRALAALRKQYRPGEQDATVNFEQAIEAMAAKPVAEQDWGLIDAMVEKVATEGGLSAARHKILQANVMMRRDKFAEAEVLIREASALDKDDINVRYAAIAFLLSNPEKGADDAMALLDKLVERFGDSARARITRATILRVSKDENLEARLPELAQDIDQWSKEEQVQVLASIATQFEQLRKNDEARTYWKQAIELIPDSLPIRTHLFELAFGEQNIDEMHAAEKLILDLVGDVNDGNLVLCAVRRTMLEYAQQKVPREELVRMRGKLDELLKDRPQWHEAHILYGQVLLVLQEDTSIAMEHLEEALKYGPANINALALHVKLLGQSGNLVEARKKLDLLPEAVRQQVLGRAEAEILIQTGELEAGHEAAKKLAELESTNATTQIWFSRIASQTEHLDAAAEAMERASLLTPTDADMWLQLIGTYAQLKDIGQIEDSLRRAMLSIEGDSLTLMTAKKYELTGDWQAAEKIYQAAFGLRMDVADVSRRMAEFYLLWARAGKVPASRVHPYLNQILRQVNEGTLPISDPNAMWAREQAVQLLVSTGDFQDFLKAEKLLRNSRESKDLSPAELALLAQILSVRPEPEFQLKAISILSDMDRAGTISKPGVMALARLLSKSDNWERGKELMVNAITKYGDDEEVLASFVELLIEQGEFATAANRLEKLRDINPKNSQYLPLTIKLVAEKGDQSGLQKILERMLPNLAGALSEQQLAAVLNVARLAAQNSQHDLANKLYPYYVQRDSSAGLEYCQYLAMNGDVEKAMSIMKQVFPTKMDDVLQIAASMLRSRRPEFGDKYDAEIDEMAAAAHRDDPDSIRRMLIQAEIRELEGKYAEAIENYDAVLKRDDLPRMMRAAAMNNLGYILILNNERMEESEELINKALEIYGPVEDILDTRALVRIARKHYDEAVADLTLATSLSRDPVKFYHLAVANLLAGNNQACIKAWDRAQELDFIQEKLPFQEQSEFEQNKAKIESLRGLGDKT